MQWSSIVQCTMYCKLALTTFMAYFYDVTVTIIVIITILSFHSNSAQYYHPPSIKWHSLELHSNLQILCTFIWCIIRYIYTISFCTISSKQFNPFPIENLFFSNTFSMYYAASQPTAPNNVEIILTFCSMTSNNSLHAKFNG